MRQPQEWTLLTAAAKPDVRGARTDRREGQVVLVVLVVVVVR